MQQIINFFIKNKNFLLFAFLFSIAFLITVQSHSFHNSSLVSSTNFLSGGLYSIKSDVTNYFGLRTQNTILLEENSRLRNQIRSLDVREKIPALDTLILPSSFGFLGANVINNNYSKTRNYITLSSGENEGIRADMGVITSKGLVGIVNKTSFNYARVQSILNENSQINAKLKKSTHFGFLVWDAENPNIVQLTEIPKLAPVAVGDTIITGGNSAIFPRGILIGTVKDFAVRSDDTFTLQIKLFNDMTNLNHVYIISNPNREEIEKLELDDAE